VALVRLHWKWRYWRLRLPLMAYGLTHRMCWQCHEHKGLNLNRCCDSCQVKNIIALLDEPEEACK
jgi:hypothetical protein